MVSFIRWSSDLVRHILRAISEASGDSFEIGDGRILTYSSIGVQNSIL